MELHPDRRAFAYALAPDGTLLVADAYGAVAIMEADRAAQEAEQAASIARMPG